VTVNQTTGTVYVTNFDNDMVSVINGQTNTVTAASRSGRTDGVAVNPSTNTIYTANPGDGTVSVINGQNNHGDRHHPAGSGVATE